MPEMTAQITVMPAQAGIQWLTFEMSDQSRQGYIERNGRNQNKSGSAKNANIKGFSPQMNADEHGCFVVVRANACCTWFAHA